MPKSISSDPTKVTNHYIAACEQYQYDHQDVQSHYPCRNRSPICKTISKITLGFSERKENISENTKINS